MRVDFGYGLKNIRVYSEFVVFMLVGIVACVRYSVYELIGSNLLNSYVYLSYGI